LSWSGAIWEGWPWCSDLSPLALFFVALMIAGRRSLDGKIPKLIAEINAILGSSEMS
jgi:hypothetical protein